MIEGECEDGRGLPPPAIIRRTPGRLSLASWTPPELASVSPVEEIVPMKVLVGNV